MIISEIDRRQLLDVFAAEAEETLSNFEDLLLRLEETPDAQDLLHEIFRAAHTLKGNAASLQFAQLAAFAHVVEETLEKLRSREIHATAKLISQLLEAVDALRDLTARSIAAGECELTRSQSDLLASLSMRPGNDSTSVVRTPESKGDAAGTQQRLANSLRVDRQKLDRMLDLTGEIAIARGRVFELVARNQERERTLDAVRELDRLSLDLQELVMNARMVAVGPALRHFQRVVRDLAASARKRVALVIEGNEVEVDTTVIEHLRDPITQMVRNAVDHGIETPDQRVVTGKSLTGTIRISASHESGAVVIRVSDDGRGLNEASIARRARAIGIDPDHLSRQDLLSLIFQPGFSTVSEVTEISGRGVGMDVVQRNVQSLRGSVIVSSEEGQGTTITMRLPLTIALIDGFSVGVGDETYILPVDAVVECIELPADAGRGSRGVLNLRGAPLPFVRLRDLFDFGSKPPARENVVIVEHEQGRAGIVVDELLGGNQAVIKPLSRALHRVVGVAGSSILGNGRVALILDPEQIVRRAAEMRSTSSNVESAA